MLTYDDLPQRLNLAGYFVDRNLDEGRADKVALVCGERRCTYAELAELINRTGHVLRDLGVRPGDRVLIAVGDGIEFVAIWYAVLKIGAVVADVYTFLQPKDYAYYLDYTQAPVAVVDAGTLSRVREGAQLQGGRYLRELLVVGDDPDEFAARVAQAPGDLDPEPTTRDDIAIWKFTTGSTGAPKAAVHCVHDPIICFHSYARTVLGYREDDVVLPVPKLFFGYARDATALFSFGVGATGVVFAERSTPQRLFELISRHRPTILVQVPTMIKEMVAHPDAGNQDLSCLRLCISSGEALPADLYRAWYERFGVEVLDGVGSSEAYHIYISNRSGEVRPGSVGRVVPGYEALVVGSDCAPAPVDESGELWVRGDSAALMYW
ncbi:MAG: AMP-binding protein, partial [Solirubrobacteraceae bacterium]